MASAREELLNAKNTIFDVLIVGGGIVGTGIARDASLRGMSVGLFEKEDLSAGTTSRSSRLIHGGLRYLDLYDFGLVFKDLREREKLLRTAPHLVRPLKFVVPNYNKSAYQRLRLRAGMLLYDLFSFGKSIPSHKVLSAQEVSQLEPSLSKDGLQGGALFYDCQASFVERLSVENAISASENDAKIFNHVKVLGITGTSDGLISVVIQEMLSGDRFEFRSRSVVNASGPWADDVLEHVSLKRSGESGIRKTKGVHVAIPKVNENAVVLYAESDERLFFVLPWLDYTLIGTTDTDYSGDPGESEATPEDISYLINESSKFLPAVKAQKIAFTYSGVRPLVRARKNMGKDESAVSRNYRIDDDCIAGKGIVISALGVKITSYRIASEDATDLIAKKLGVTRKCITDKEPLPGGRTSGKFSDFEASTIGDLVERGFFDEKQARHLFGIYGTRVGKIVSIIESDRTKIERICPNNPDVLAQITLAVEEEFALTVSDFMLRRVPIAFSHCRGLDCAPKVAGEMGELLNWDTQRVEKELRDYKVDLERQIPITPWTTTKNAT